VSAVLSWDETVAVLQGVWVELQSNARAFQTRARGRPALLSAHQWGELADIEALTLPQLERALRSELHVEPGGTTAQVRIAMGSLRDGLRSERALLEALARRPSAHQIESWRAGTPQLEGSLWPWLADRCQHLANAVALALSEPAPYTVVIWQPRERRFQR
jgi:hypothetical protein